MPRGERCLAQRKRSREGPEDFWGYHGGCGPDTQCGDRAVGEPTTPCGRAEGHDLWDALDRPGCARIFGLTRGGKCIADMGVKRKGRLVAAKGRSRKSVVGSQRSARRRIGRKESQKGAKKTQTQPDPCAKNRE